MEVEVQFDYKAENEDELTIKVGDVITNVAQHEDGWWEGDFNGRRGVFPDNFVKVRTATESKKTASRSSPLIVDQNPTNSGGGGGGVTLRKEKKRRCKVLFSYKPMNEDELELEVDDLVDVLEEVEEGWWKGTVKGKTGVFPSNFVQELEQTEAEKEQDKDVCSEIKPKPVKGIGYGNIFQDGMVKLKTTTAQDNKSEPKGAFPPPKKPPFPSSVAAVAVVTPSAPQLPPKPVKEQARVLYSYEAQNDDELSLKEGDLITIVSKDIEDAGWWKGELGGRIGVFPDNFVELIAVDGARPKKPDRPGKGPSLPNSKSADSEMTNDSNNTEPPSGNREKILSLPRGLSAKRLPPDVPKKDGSDDRMEKTIDKPLPPLPGKKPNLPPPLKKTQRHSLGYSLGSSTAADAPSTAAPLASPVIKKPFVLPVSETTATHDVDEDKSKSSPSQDDDKLGFDGIESASEKLVHLTANRAKNPHRRPPSHVFHRDGDKVNGDVGGVVENGENPWKLEMKRNQAAKRLSQAVAESGIKDTIPEVEEKSSSRGNSLNRPEKNDKLGAKPTAATVASNVTKQSPLPLTAAQKASTFATEVDSKDTKLPKAAQVQSETAVPRGSQIPEPSTVMSIEEKLNLRIEQLQRQYSELSEEFASHKFSTMTRIGELYGELQIEKKHRLTLQAELETLRREARK